MASVELTTLSEPAQVFRDHILTNLHYWQTYVVTKIDDVGALDRGRQRIVNAILFALKLEEAWPASRDLVEQFSSYMERKGYWDTWAEVLSQTIGLAQGVKDQAGVVRLLALQARLAQRQSRFGPTVRYYRQTIRLARHIGDRYNEARACSNLGYLYTELGHWQRAEVLCCHALTLFEALGSQHGRAHTHNHLGILYSWQGQWDLARQHLERACALWQEIRDQHGLMRGLINLGRLYNDAKSPTEALVYLEKALRWAELTGEEIELAQTYMNMGISHRIRSEAIQAEKCHWQAESIFRCYSNLVGLAEIQDNLGLVCIDQEKWQEAILHLDTALNYWRKMANKYGETRTLMYMVEYELARGERQRAAGRLTEVERLINLTEFQGKYQNLHQKMREYRRRLTVT